MINAYDLKGTSSSDRQPLRCFNTTFHEWRRGKDSCVSVCTRTHERSLEQSLSGSSRPAQVRPSPGCLGLSDPAFLLSMLFPSSQIHPPQAFCQWKSLLVENTVPPRPLSEPALLFLLLLSSMGFDNAVTHAFHLLHFVVLFAIIYRLTYENVKGIPIYAQRNRRLFRFRPE